MTLVFRQCVYIATVIATGVAYVAVGHQFNGVLFLMLAVTVAAIVDTHFTSRRK